MTYQEQYKDALAYIDSYWDTIIHPPTRKSVHDQVVNIPYSYVTPNNKKLRYIYYWDSYFIFQGLMGTRHEWVLKEMVHNFAYVYKTFGVIPNFNAPGGMNRSQPPFFSSMVMDTYTLWTKQKGIAQKLFARRRKSWLAKMISLAKSEYMTVWIDLDCNYFHSVNGQRLSRYGDRDVGYAHTAELESGWDFTSRFYNRCDEFLPIDLNVFLHKYEQDFANAATILSQHPEKVTYWQQRATLRAQEINRLMWNETEGFYFDYHYPSNTQSTFLSLAGFTPLWTGIASMDQAKKMVKKLPSFETEYGLTATDKQSLAPSIDLSHIPSQYQPAVQAVIAAKQWDYPFNWPPLEYLTVIGLLRYGFVQDAKRIMTKSLAAHGKIFRFYGTFFEKIDSANAQGSKDFHYVAQSGFGWTNAVFYRYTKLLDMLDAGRPSTMP